MNGPFRIVSLCSGIGGLELGLERAGLGRTVVQVEINSACRHILAKHWPKVVRHDDLHTWDGQVPGEGPILLTAGFPCQPYSKAGLGLAEEDPRDLWAAVARAIRLARPRVVFLENVERLLQLGIWRVLGDLAALGYDAEWDCIPAAAVGAPHLRDRVFILAYAHGGGQLHGLPAEHPAEEEQPALSLSLSLSAAVNRCPGHLLPTATLKDATGRRFASDGQPHLPGALGGLPNPEWLEWFMGFPPTWTEPASSSLGTPSSPRSPSTLAESCSPALAVAHD